MCCFLLLLLSLHQKSFESHCSTQYLFQLIHWVFPFWNSVQWVPFKAKVHLDCSISPWKANLTDKHGFCLSPRYSEPNLGLGCHRLPKKMCLLCYLMSTGTKRLIKTLLKTLFSSMIPRSYLFCCRKKQVTKIFHYALIIWHPKYFLSFGFCPPTSLLCLCHQISSSIQMFVSSCRWWTFVVFVLPPFLPILLLLSISSIQPWQLDQWVSVWPKQNQSETF